jgi:hypothetical protein
MFFLMECEDEDSLGWMVKAPTLPPEKPAGTLFPQAGAEHLIAFKFLDLLSLLS